MEISIRPSLVITLRGENAALFGDITSKHIEKQILITIGGSPITAPVVHAPITDGSISITGTEADLKVLEDAFKALQPRWARVKAV